MTTDAVARLRAAAEAVMENPGPWQLLPYGESYAVDDRADVAPALAAAVLALLPGAEPHIYSGLCPDDDDWRVMDAMCPACRALAAAADMLPEDGGDE